MIGDATLDLSQGCLRRNGADVALRPKSFALLHYLVTHAGRLVSKDELLSKIWPGVIVTEDSLTRCISEVRAALEDTGQTVVKTVSKRGYIFAGPVTLLDDDAVSEPAAGPIPAARRDVRRAGWMLPLFGLAGVLAIAGVIWSTMSWRHAPVPPRLSLIVLPFSNLSADPAQDYLGDIITDELTTALSRLRGSTVISARSAFTLKDKPVHIKQLGADFGVSYALEGSVLRSDGSVRINARLVDAQSAKTLWSDQFDVRRAELLQTQDDIVTRLASALHVELVRAETGRVTAVANLDAEDLAMRCEAASYRLGAAAASTYELCERALDMDPRNVRALIRLASYYASRVSRVQSPNRAADLQRAESLVNRALEIDPGYYAAYCLKAIVLEGTHHVRNAVVAAERCLALNPSYAGAYKILALQYFFLAEPDKVLEYAEHGIRLSPHDPETAIFLLLKGWAYFLMEKDDEALVWLRRAAAASPEIPTILAGLASSLALTGHDAEARATLTQYLALPATLTRTIAQWDYVPDANPAFMKFHLRFKEGLRKAGMPER
ncbi:winged helix-turn-helix domain-containing tetratricopeptide repeat protein [Bradyrhizobium sp. CCGUVB23]|uniref:winged helix-turn-helix domain-containing tetratricopeptide repeat protein n=1 Tax=Bradyrhizobium sp. CCGUVB23 TaxID=2949630 RepID=UPI0020B34000|nr:winged helix-turn-helix domain-containing protein [Bradyrhizobium sp. CCGUVB23]MCP3460412.1 winged helix-turn-helix domain-containing protein [Bradyrhizobium sp. CCGUVB23]